MNRNQEAKRWIEEIYSHPDWGHTEINWQAIDEIRELLGKQDKYKWHDLRNNADDLPREDTNCLVLLNDYQYSVSSYSVHEMFGGVWECEAYDYWVLAWRYLEEYEKCIED